MAVWSDEQRWVDFGACLMRPARRRLVEALEVVTGIAGNIVREAVAAPGWSWDVAENHNGLSWSKDGEHWVPSGHGRPRTPQQAWRALHDAGVIPADWLDSRARRFFRGGATPSRLEATVAFAADVEGVLAVEAQARVLARRLTRWLDRPAAAAYVHWRMLADIDQRSIAWEDHLAYGLGGAALTSLMADAAGPERWGYRKPALTAVGEVVATSARASHPEWSRDVSEGIAAMVSAAQYWSEAAHDVDPFEPLLAIWSRGYGVLDVGRHVTLLAAGMSPTRLGS